MICSDVITDSSAQWSIAGNTSHIKNYSSSNLQFFVSNKDGDKETRVPYAALKKMEATVKQIQCKLMGPVFEGFIVSAS